MSSCAIWPLAHHLRQPHKKLNFRLPEPCQDLTPPPPLSPTSNVDTTGDRFFRFSWLWVSLNQLCTQRGKRGETCSRAERKLNFLWSGCMFYMCAAHSSIDLSVNLSFLPSVHCSVHLFVHPIVRTCQRTWGWTDAYAFDCGPTGEDRWMGRTCERMRGLGPVCILLVSDWRSGPVWRKQHMKRAYPSNKGSKFYTSLIINQRFLYKYVLFLGRLLERFLTVPIQLLETI